MPMERSVSSRALALLAVAGLVGSGPAQAADPIRIGVIAEAQSVVGASIPQAVQLAADEINAKGGVDGRQIQVVTYDDKSSASYAVRAFQRAGSEDKVNLVIASYIPEVVLALMPWAARPQTPLITPGAAANEFSLALHKDIARKKHTFHGYPTSAASANQPFDSTN
ncbi:ABC transporter substrate-binding protein, partial [Methylobacterium sp. J-030]|uniref:ABC transporter substrate-binding protein n=1 Tax=Methylobacterium sp. J-030 TaxID=2836627 RepID=UPI001FBBFF6F